MIDLMSQKKMEKNHSLAKKTYKNTIFAFFGGVWIR
jgi:hypothetical protein